jgi:hypothetical protein
MTLDPDQASSRSDGKMLYEKNVADLGGPQHTAEKQSFSKIVSARR